LNYTGDYKKRVAKLEIPGRLQDTFADLSNSFDDFTERQYVKNSFLATSTAVVMWLIKIELLKSIRIVGVAVR
jgi:hypothetical protein